MTEPQLLSDDQITETLRDLPGWEPRPGALFREVEAPTFMAGIRLVDEVAEVAEQLNHHPDIAIRWRTVAFTLSTHVRGGVTQYDVDLARRISAVIDQQF
jgi:4a-hydroxytetrahydrobiopterin dehydratase